MGQAISSILGCLLGGTEKIENEKPRSNHEDYSPLPSSYIDIIERHNYKNKAAEVATSIHRHQLPVTISRQRQQLQPQQKVASDPLVEVGKPRPSHEKYCPLPSHCINISEQHNYKKEVATNIHRHHLPVTISRQQQQQQPQQKVVPDPIVEVEKPRPLPSHCIDIIEQHNYKKKAVEVATNIRRHHLSVTISRKQEQLQPQQKIVSDPFEVKKPRPSHENHSLLQSHCIDIIEQHNYKKAAEVATNIHRHHLPVTISRQQEQLQPQQKIASDPLEVKKPRPSHENHSLLQSHCIDIIEQHNYKKAAEVATNIHRHHLPVTTSRQQEQLKPQQKVVSDPLVKVEKPRPSHENHSPLPSHSIDIIEQHSCKKKAEVATNIHRHHLPVTLSRQQQQQRKFLSDPLVEVDLRQPLIATNSIVASIAGAKNTKELIIKAATKEANSTKRSESKNKKEEIRKIGPYINTQKILLVGEGDFSFSAALAVAFGYAPRIVATSLNNKVFLMKNYKKSMANIENLESRGALVLHGVDATNMASHRSFNGVKFDRIIFNFPHTSSFGRTSSDISRHQQLVRGFLRNAKKMVEEDAGEIHVTHKTSPAYIKWNIVQLGFLEDLYLIEACPFDPSVYPGYDTKYGHGGDKNFDWFPCKIYKFGLVCQGLI